MALDDFAQLPFTLHVPGGETLEFDTYETVARWAEKEQEAWDVVVESRNDLGPASQVAVDKQISLFNEFIEPMTILMTDQRTPTARDEVARLLDLIAQGNVVVSTSPTGRKILDLITTDPSKALGHLIWALPDIEIFVDQTDDLEPILKTLIDVRLDQREGIGDVAAEKAALESLRAKWEADFATIHDLENRAREGFEGYVSDTKNIVAGRIQVGRRVGRRFLNRLGRMRRDHDKQMRAIRQTFRAELSLREPAKYWTTKARWHLAGAAMGFIGLLATAGLIVAFVIWGPSLVLTSEVVGILEYASVLLVALPALALFWIMKAIARIFVTNIQLHADAGLRHTMVTTFISLMQDPKNQMSTEDRILILQALFRPAGAEAHEEGPPNWVDVLLRRMEGQSK